MACENSIQGLFAAVVVSSSGKSVALSSPKLCVAVLFVVEVLKERVPYSITIRSPA